MDQIVTIANQLIAFIVNVTFFLVVYGTAFYFIGVILYGIARTVYERFSPFWKKWYQSIRRRKH